jgi:hypothetical protein
MGSTIISDLQKFVGRANPGRFVIACDFHDSRLARSPLQVPGGLRSFHHHAKPDDAGIGIHRAGFAADILDFTDGILRFRSFPHLAANAWRILRISSVIESTIIPGS